MYEKLIDNLKEHAEWARANEWETPITLYDDIVSAIMALRNSGLPAIKNEQAIMYLDQLENMLIRIETSQDADWKDVLYVTRACHWLFKEIVKNGIEKTNI